MPKAEKGSIKDIGKRIKAKGLQRLRFYCQMCEKQCRDANGFKCHLTSESHLRQMKVFSENSKGYMSQYSREFEKVFLDTLRTRHTTTKVSANNVYQEVIQDKQHIHMNATVWSSLTAFCQYLGRKGLAKVEETERGWFVQYIERDMAKQQRDEALAKRKEAEAQAEEVFAAQLQQKRTAAAKEMDKFGASMSTTGTNLERSESDAPIQVSLAAVPSANVGPSKKRSIVNAFGDESEDDNEKDKEEKDEKEVKKPPQFMPPTKQKRPVETKAPEVAAWVQKGIMVRVVTKSLKDYFRKKGTVERVKGHVATVSIVDTGDVLEIDEQDLDTVIPKVDQKARILKGQNRGSKARVVELDSDKYLGVLRLKDGTLVKLDYADFSKTSS